jgi:ketol-acid reductoisomerase
MFGGLIRTLELDREAIAARFRAVLDDIRSGAFARRFQDEARNGYPVLDLARAMIRGSSPMTEAEDHLRQIEATMRRGAPSARGV